MSSKTNENVMTSTSETKPVDFDDIIPMLGNFGRYQVFLFISMVPFLFCVTFVYFVQFFITLVPDVYYCNVPDLNHLSEIDRLKLAIPLEGDRHSKCEMYAVNFTDIINQGITVADPLWPKVSCQHGWTYDRSEIPYETVATEFNWVCKSDALPAYAQAIFFCGAIVGGLLFGWVADRFGRVQALFWCNTIGAVAGFATAFVVNFWQFALLRFFVGFAYDNCFIMMYIVALEYVVPKWRTFVANFSIAVFFTLASCTLPWIAYYLSNWKYLAMITSLPLLFGLIAPFFVPESARWLVSQGRIDEATAIIKKFERINRKEIPANVYTDFYQNCQKVYKDEVNQKRCSTLDLFKTPRLRRFTILLISIWMIISLVFDGHVRNVGSLGLDVFLTFTIACATEFPADSFLVLVMDKWGRRWLAFGTLVLSGTFSLLATVVPSGPYLATFAIIGRFFINITYNIGLQYAAELLPTVVRGQGVTFIHIMGFVASIFSPFVVYLGNFSQVLPLIILGVAGICGGILSLFLPETLGKTLPQTLADGEEFGKEQKFWEAPCIQGNVDDLDDNNDHFTRYTPARASLQASTRGEVTSSAFRRSYGAISKPSI